MNNVRFRKSLTMISKTSLSLFLLSFGLCTTAPAQTKLAGNLEITLPAGVKHEALRGIDSSPGKITTKDGLEISYDIGGVVKPGGLALGGSYSNWAARMPMEQRQWLKEQTIGGRAFSIAYGKDQRLTVSSASATHGVNFSAVAKTPAEVADVLLITLSLAEAKK